MSSSYLLQWNIVNGRFLQHHQIEWIVTELEDPLNCNNLSRKWWLLNSYEKIKLPLFGQPESHYFFDLKVQFRSKYYLKWSVQISRSTSWAANFLHFLSLSTLDRPTCQSCPRILTSSRRFMLDSFTWAAHLFALVCSFAFIFFLTAHTPPTKYWNISN